MSGSGHGLKDSKIAFVIVALTVCICSLRFFQFTC